MPEQPRFALTVTDLAASIAFAVDFLGFKLAETQPESADMKYLLDSDGDPMMLTTPQVQNVRERLAEPRLVFKPGDTLDFLCEDIETQRATFASRGLTSVHEETNALGERKLVVVAPDNYKIVYIMPVKRSPEETIALYAQGGEDVEAAIAGLSEADLDLTRALGEWTIRQIVHHLAESASLSLMTIKAALAQSGSTYVRPPYDQEHWAETLAYDRRPIEPSLALIKAIHAHITQLFQYVPDCWDHYTMMKFPDQEGEGRKLTLGYLIDIQIGHTADHCDEIRETRRVHNR